MTWLDVFEKCDIYSTLHSSVNRHSFVQIRNITAVQLSARYQVMDSSGLVATTATICHNLPQSATDCRSCRGGRSSHGHPAAGIDPCCIAESGVTKRYICQRSSLPIDSPHDTAHMEKITDKIAALPPGSNYFSLEFFPPKTQMVRFASRY